MDCIYFDCTSWSDFVDEDEKLFLGGLCFLGFNTIRNLAKSPVQNYKVYVKAMSMFYYIIRGFGWNASILGNIRKCHAKGLQLLITEEMNGKYAISSESESVLPRYVVLLFHHFVNQIRELEIDWAFFKEGQYWWYSHLVPVLSNDDGSELNLDIYLRILPNIRSIYIYNAGWNKKPSFPLDLSLKTKLLSAVKDVNERNAVCSSIALEKPIGDLDKFIDENNAEFQSEDWYLEKKQVESIFHTSYKPHPDTLCVVRKE